MQVFRDAVERYGGPLPLSDFLGPRVPIPEELQQRRADALDREQHKQQQQQERNRNLIGPSHDEGRGALKQVGGTASTEHTYVDRKNLFDAVLHDQDFALVVTFLLSGASVNEARSVDGATPLHVAAAGTTRPVGELLHRRQHRRRASLAASGDGLVGLGDGDGAVEETLDVPCLNRLILAFLIDNGADVNARAAVGGETPLMVACAAQNVSVVNLLLAKGAQTDLRDFHGRTCLSYAALHPHMLQTLLVWVGEGAMAALAMETSLLHQVCRLHGTRYSVLYLLEQLGLQVNVPENPSAASRPERATVAGNSGGYSPTSIEFTVLNESNGGSGTTPTPTTTAAAAAAGVVGADASAAAAKSSSGDTPLHCAVETGDLALVITLLGKGADPQAVSSLTNRTPVDLSTVGREAAVDQYLCVRRKLLFIPIHLRMPRILVRALGWFVARVALPIADVESVAMWSPLMQAMGIEALVKLCATAPSSRAELLLAKMEHAAAPSGGLPLELSDIAAFQYYTAFIGFFLLPQLVVLLSTFLFSSFLVNLAVALLIVTAFVRIKRLDEATVGCRSLRSVGFAAGMLVMQALCLPLYTTMMYYSYYVFDEESHDALTLWLIPSAVASGVLGLWVVCVSPGTASSTPGHRKGIYAAIAHAKTTATSSADVGKSRGGLPKELVYSTDVNAMVKKPLRAQRCRHTNRLVLRYDHYCAYLASPIGARNHRPYFFLLLSLLSLFSSFYYYACGYHRMLSRASQQYAMRQDEPYITNEQRAAMAPMENALFSTPYFRFGYMYTQVFLPIILLLLVAEVYAQFFAILRGLTWFDLNHAEDESSIYCFVLGEQVYSLFDRGAKQNLLDFFLFRDPNFAAVQYRVPQMNAHLKKAVEEHQRWQLTRNDGCGCGHAHGQDGHAHGEAAEAEEGDGQEQQQHEVKEAATSGVSGGNASATPTLTKPPLKAATAAAAGVVGPGKADGAHGGGSSSTDRSAATVSQMAQHIFQEMLRSGSDDIALAHHSSAQLASFSGDTAQTQVEWEQAVEQAKAMFAFFRQSMATSAQNAFQSGGGAES